MLDSPLRQVRQVIVTREVVDVTMETLRMYGARECEGLVLWLGIIENDLAKVQVALTPPQESVSSERGVGYFVTGDTLFQLNKTLSEMGLRLIAQVHSHPGEAYHSEADDRYAIVTAEGGFSLVVPNFGDAPAEPASWADYRLLDSEWHRIPYSEARAFFVIAEGHA